MDKGWDGIGIQFYGQMSLLDVRLRKVESRNNVKLLGEGFGWLIGSHIRRVFSSGLGLQVQYFVPADWSTQSAGTGVGLID
jgi:hypothetical protein